MKNLANKYIELERKASGVFAESFLRVSRTAIASGACWYNKAYTFAYQCANKYNTPFIKVCGIISALSPQKSWPENQKLAINFLESKKVGHTNVVVQKCMNIYNLELSFKEQDDIDSIQSILGGLKTRDFFKAIYQPHNTETFTIDRQILDLLNWDKKHITKKEYSIVKKCGLETAKLLQLNGNILQAILWVHVKELKDHYNENNPTVYFYTKEVPF